MLVASATGWIALATGISGLVLAVASLVWQAATFVLSGSRVRVRLRRGALGLGARVLAPHDATDEALASMAQQGYGEGILAVEVVNVGRLAVSVAGITAMLENGFGFSQPGDSTNPDLPFRLEAQSKETWHIRLQPLQLAVQATSDRPLHARLVVELGNGKVITTKERVLVR